MKQRAFKYRIRPANGLIALLISVTGIKGLILFGTIHVPRPFFRDKARLAWLVTRAEQIQRHGLLRFTWNDCYWSLRHGPARNPYRVEARQAVLDGCIQIR